MPQSQQRSREARAAARRAIEVARRRLAAAIHRDALLISAENVVTDLTRTINLLVCRLREWYALHFALEVEDPAQFARLVLALDKSDPAGSTRAAIEILGEDGKELAASFQTAMGLELTKEDLAAVRAVAQRILDLMRFRAEIEAYAERLTREVCPNLAEVGGPRIAAKLLAHAGGLQRLARMPASTIQILGAEKALFKHLKKRAKPPKHGIIFQHAAIHSAPKELRGKIARALAIGLSIAARVDAYGKRFIGKELRGKFEAKLKEILKNKK